MADMEDVINQAISDFDDIKAAIEEQGVEVPAGTDTKEYGGKIRSIPKGNGNVDLSYNPESSNPQSGFAVAEALENGVAIKYLESPKDNKLYLRDIESGYYVMSGYFIPYPNCKSTVVMDTMYTSVARLNAGSHIMTISPLNFRITCYEILVDDTNEDGFTYTSTRVSLLDLPKLVSDMGDIDNALDSIIEIQEGLIGTITFEIEDEGVSRAYTALKGMSWAEWVNSQYNTDGILTIDQYDGDASLSFESNGDKVINSEGEYQSVLTVIENGGQYAHD